MRPPSTRWSLGGEGRKPISARYVHRCWTAAMRTSMRRHILSSRRGGPIVAERNGSLYPSRYASIRTSRELTLFGGSVHRMRSVFSVNLGRCDLPSGLSSLRVDQVRIAQSPYVRSEAIGQKKPWPQSHFSLGSSLLCSGIFTSSLSVGSLCSIAALSLSRLLLSTPMGVVEWLVDLSAHP